MFKMGHFQKITEDKELNTKGKIVIIVKYGLLKRSCLEISPYISTSRIDSGSFTGIVDPICFINVLSLVTR